MGIAETPYEELRRRKLEENKKKIEELKLNHLSFSLREESAAAKPSPIKPRTKTHLLKTHLPITVRRSKRKRDPVSYKDVGELDKVRFRKTSAGKKSVRRDILNRVYATDEAREYAAQMASALQEKMRSAFPSFIKLMLQSHVTGGFWLGLPRSFCTKNLPKKDTALTLVDERGEESTVLYLALKNGLSAGWRGFAISHELVDGDAVIFELVSSITFKVYIIRQSGYYERETRSSKGKAKAKRKRR